TVVDVRGIIAGSSLMVATAPRLATRVSSEDDPARAVLADPARLCARACPHRHDPEPPRLRRVARVPRPSPKCGCERSREGPPPPSVQSAPTAHALLTARRRPASPGLVQDTPRP